MNALITKQKSKIDKLQLVEDVSNCALLSISRLLHNFTTDSNQSSKSNVSNKLPSSETRHFTFTNKYNSVQSSLSVKF